MKEKADKICDNIGKWSKIMKKEIVKALYEKLEQKDLNGLYEKINEYKKENPYDMDIFIWETKYYLETENYEKALKIASEGVNRYPYTCDTNNNYADVLMVCKEYLQAYKYYYRAKWIETQADLNGDITELLKTVECIIRDISNISKDEVEYNKFVSEFSFYVKVAFGLQDDRFRLQENILGEYISEIYNPNKYIGTYNSNVGMETMNTDMTITPYNTKLEILDVKKENEFIANEDMLLPVLTESEDNIYAIVHDGEQYFLRPKKIKHFNYYNLKKGDLFASKKECIMANPIKQKCDNNKKKLVLNIFVDGLSQKILEEENIEKVMPYTAKFFGSGIICSNAYVTSDWTYPSVATLNTGVYSTNHMMLNPNVSLELPKNITVMAEYFKEAGYYTAKIDGDWRSSINYGYGRGIDRTVYQTQNIGMQAENVVMDAIEHLELSRDTNQYLWICLGDLHDIADELELMPFVQKDIESRYWGISQAGETSVKQYYDINKRKAYIKQLKRIDMCLNVLYNYINDNYKDSEILIGMFGDHGQGYLVKEEEHFLSDGRSKIGMMFRCDYKKGHICNEIISSVDYIAIMLKLAGIELKDEKIDARLPKFFGGEAEREYALTESIHINDPYYAALHFKDKTFYLTMNTRVLFDSRFKLKECDTYIINKNEEKIIDDEFNKSCMELIMKHIAANIIYE